MLRLKATKTSLYKLVAEYVDDLPPMRSGTQFIKYPNATDYAMNWITPQNNHGTAFFAVCAGRPQLYIDILDRVSGKTIRWALHHLDPQDLRERGMVEEFVTAEERRRLERGVNNDELSPAT